MRKFFLAMMTTFLLVPAAFSATESTQSVVTMDEDLWVVFYDVPSRRFRTIRNDFVRRQFEAATADLTISSSYLVIESDRAQPQIASRLREVADRLAWIAENISDDSVTGAELDSVFGRAHWLLAQHYLDMARNSRDAAQNRNAGLYLWATTHHLERAVLWSNARIDRSVQKTLEDLRDLATKIQDAKTANKAYGEKPMLRADKLLRELGQLIDRPVVISAQ